MSTNHERSYSHEDPLADVAELLLQEPVRKNLKAALGIIEWDKSLIRSQGIDVRAKGTYVSTTANVYEICSLGRGNYAVWKYGLNTLNDAGRPVAPSMQQYVSMPGVRDGVVRITPESDHLELPGPSAYKDEEGNTIISVSIDVRGPDITIDEFNPAVIYVENSSVPALESSTMLRRICATGPRQQHDSL